MYKQLFKDYSHKKKDITNRINEFRKLKKVSSKKIFEELCFCILTPQSKAVYADRSIKQLIKGSLYREGIQGIRKCLHSVRFPNNKSKYILLARNLFFIDGEMRIKQYIDAKDIHATREFFVKNVKGIGFKEASHFLRNIGYGENIAILDVHILRNLKKYKLINDIPKTISKKQYYLIEQKMRKFSEQIKIPFEHLDLLFWSIQTGFIFK